MLKINEKVRDEIVNIIAGSDLPTNQGIGIINVLNKLEAIVEEPLKEAEAPKK